jgi:hypothetical protein
MNRNSVSTTGFTTGVGQGESLQTSFHAPTPVTKPPVHPFVPPSPYPSKPSPDGFWFGTNNLWTDLGADETWSSLPHWSDGTFRQKLFWWRQGYDVHTEPQPKLTVTGTRLGSSALPLLLADRASNGWVQPDQPFMVVGINLPTLGCWKITAHYQDEDLSFVVWVTP